MGNLIQTRTHCPQQPFEAPHQTQYQYDNLGRIQQEKIGTQRHTFYFDLASNLINDPTEKVINNRLSHYQGVRYTYDSLGNLTECQTANGDYQRYTYDVSTRSRPKAAGKDMSMEHKPHDVSTHSRPKAAGTVSEEIFAVLLVSIHSRLKAAGGDWGQSPQEVEVSTHSRLKAAGMDRRNHGFCQ